MTAVAAGGWMVRIENLHKHTGIQNRQAELEGDVELGSTGQKFTAPYPSQPADRRDKVSDDDRFWPGHTQIDTRRVDEARRGQRRIQYRYPRDARQERDNAQQQTGAQRPPDNSRQGYNAGTIDIPGEFPTAWRRHSDLHRIHFLEHWSSCRLPKRDRRPGMTPGRR